MFAGKRFQRLDGRVDVGGFGIVVVVDAADSGHEFQPVLDRFEVVNGTAESYRERSPSATPAANRGQNILQIVRAFQRNLRDLHESRAVPKRRGRRCCQSRTHAPRSTSLLRLNQKTCARVFFAMATQVGSSALSTAKSSGC